MAGNYPDIPNPRIEYDRDGTRAYHITSGGVATEWLTATKQSLNNEIYTDTPVDLQPGQRAFFVFPELRDITHLFMDVYSSSFRYDLEWSSDSTTGVDGTWTRAVTGFAPAFQGQTSSGGYRTLIQPVAGLTGVKMMRIVRNGGGATWDYIGTLHLYGKRSAGQSLHRLRLWHPTNDQPLDDFPAWFDWGNAEQGSSATRQFRIKNDSPSLTAAGITAFMQALTEANPTQVSQHQLSKDNTTFTVASTPMTVPNLAPQAISSVLYLRRNSLSNAQLGLWRQRLVATADTWS